MLVDPLNEGLLDRVLVANHTGEVAKLKNNDENVFEDVDDDEDRMRMR